jgi:hypothetical protein
MNMAGGNKASAACDPIVKPFVEFWSDYLKQANDATREFLDDIDGQADIKSFQRRWFDTVSKSAEAYMRTPAFLQSIKQNTDAAIKLKLQADDVANELARNANIPTAGDISGLFERLHSVEEAILDRLSRIDVRLESIEQKIGSGELTND